MLVTFSQWMTKQIFFVKIGMEGTMLKRFFKIRMEGNGSLERFESENQLWLQFRSVIEQVIFYWTQVSQVSDLWVPMSVTELPC